MKLLLLLSMLLSMSFPISVVQPIFAQTQQTTGDCSPAVAQVSGSVNITCNSANTTTHGPIFSVTYYRVQRSGVDFLLDGLLSPEWEKLLGGQQAIVKNAILHTAHSFLESYGTSPAGTALYAAIPNNPNAN